MAAPVEPVYDFFEDLPDATWGGSGIPTGPAAIKHVPSLGANIALIAHHRYNNPPLANDGAGNYFALPGANDGTPGNPGDQSTWNIGLYVNLPSSFAPDEFEFRFYYDVDPGANTDLSEMGYLTARLSTGEKREDSQNMTFDFLRMNVPGMISPPSYPDPFDPFAEGEYSFALIAVDENGDELPEGRVAINVYVGAQAVPDAGGTMTLLLVGGVLLVGLQRRSLSRW